MQEQLDPVLLQRVDQQVREVQLRRLRRQREQLPHQDGLRGDLYQDPRALGPLILINHLGTGLRHVYQIKAVPQTLKIILQ